MLITGSSFFCSPSIQALRGVPSTITYNSQGLRLVEACIIASTTILVCNPCTHTRQVEEVWVLVEFVEDGAGSVLGVGRGEDGYGVCREGFCKLRASLVILESGDPRCDWKQYHLAIRSHMRARLVSIPSPAWTR